MKTAVAIGRFDQVASRKAMEGEDPQETGMNEGGLESVGSKRRIQKGRRLAPFVLEGVGGRNSLPSALNHAFIILRLNPSSFFIFKITPVARQEEIDFHRP
jgi:hypothetical protein